VTVDIDRFAFEQAPDPIFRISADGCIRDANEVACRWLGHARDELLGQSIWQISLDWSEDLWPGIWRTLTDQPLGLAESDLQRQDGQRFRVDFSVRLYEGTAGTEALLFGRERLPRSDAVQELARLRELLDVAESLAKIGHWRYAVASGRPQWSDQVFAIFRRDPALGEPSFDEHTRYVAEDDWPRLREAVEDCAERGVPYALTVGIRRDDGTTGTARVYGSALPSSTCSTPSDDSRSRWMRAGSASTRSTWSRTRPSSTRAISGCSATVRTR
jgi:PAS domain S-box-containing protein